MKEKTSITGSLSNKGSLTDAEINAGFGFNTILKSPDLNGQLYDIDSQVDIITKEICNFLTDNGVTINSGDNSQLATLMSSLLSAKQNTLVAGIGITIDENGVISAQASTPANIPLFYFVWLDSLPFNVSWVNANNYSWLYGSTYVGAYNRLNSQLNPVGTFKAGDTYYVCNFSDGSMQTTTVLANSGTLAQLEAWCSAQGYTYSGTAIEEFKCYKTVSASSETIGEITITYYQTNDGKKIITSDAEIANAESIYNATGVQWYYILDTVNQRFKLPRINQNKAPIQQGTTQMYLYFYLGSSDVEEIAKIAGIKAETINNKADTDLGNITTTAKTNIVNLFAVSSTTKAITFPYTVEKAGMITCNVYTKNNIATEITVNGVQRFYGNIAGVRDGVYSIYVFPGDVVTGQGFDGKTFSPLKIYEEEGV